jgi:hypothetical protein
MLWEEQNCYIYVGNAHLTLLYNQTVSIAQTQQSTQNIISN